MYPAPPITRTLTFNSFPMSIRPMPQEGVSPYTGRDAERSRAYSARQHFKLKIIEQERSRSTEHMVP